MKVGYHVVRVSDPNPLGAKNMKWIETVGESLGRFDTRIAAEHHANDLAAADRGVMYGVVDVHVCYTRLSHQS